MDHATSVKCFHAKNLFGVNLFAGAAIVAELKDFSIEGRRQGPFTARKRAHAKIAFVKLILRGVHTKNEFWRRKK